MSSEGRSQWQEYFAFEDPYPDQGDAVEQILATGRSRGYLAVEGPCGTGKTMAALSAGATLVRETDLYDRLVVVTPVKQQLRQFVLDLRAVNAGLEDPLSGVALVGKPDLCPLDRAGLFTGDAGVHDRCEDLRDATATLVEADGDGAIGATASAEIAPPVGDDQWWDPGRASDLATAARVEDLDREAPLETAGASSPYRAVQPTAPLSMVEGDDPPVYCPFEADWYARNKGSPVDFSAGPDHVLTVEDYLPASVERGTCPHRVMGVLLESAEVVIGNYNHLFDPRTRPLVSSILDDDTFVVVDEAHRIEERVRELQSARVGKRSLVRARNDCQVLLGRAGQSDDHERQVATLLGERDVPLDALEDVRAFYDDVVDWLDARVRRYLDGEHEGWRADPGTLPARDREIPLRDPDTVEPDELTRWAERSEYDGDLWRSLSRVGAAVEEVLDTLGEARQPVCAAVGATMTTWWERDHSGYLREVELEDAPVAERHAAVDYEQAYTAGLLLYNCMPARSLRDVFEELGGGVLMSATLEPLDVFTRVSGLDHLEADESAGEARPVRTRSYGLSFPPENRASWLVDCRPFTANNRGDPDRMRPLGEDWNPTRDEYAHAIRALARSPGNVMVAMPNYREAHWAGAYLETVVDKPVIVDESSSNEDTNRRKAAFFRGEGKVLVTSTRGTLTEGVDYDGAKLSTCAVVGVPLVNVGSPRVRAVKRAYGEAFGEENAFEYALTVPAVRRARQAIGRVIRGTEEVGVRAFVGRRYCPGERHSVYGYLPAEEREEFTRMTPEFLADQIDAFWRDR